MQEKATNEYNEKQKALGAIESQQNIVSSLAKEKEETKKQLATTQDTFARLQQSIQANNENDIDTHTQHKQTVQKEFDSWMS